jgi:hypothetical protein
VNRFLRILPLLIATAFAAVPLLIFAPTPASATHSWGGYHWARTSNPFTLKVGDNVNSTWDAFLDLAILDWTESPVLNLTKDTGGTNPKNCRPTAGRIEVCNSKYGNNGWLGIAQIWITGGEHITQGVAKMNDTYFNTATYNTPAWRRLVMCQEIAHDFGLDHQDENFNNGNLGSCMDYTSDPDGPPSNEHPNSHDFQQLQTIYSHTDSTSTISSALAPAPGRSGTAADEGPNNPSEFGRATGRKDGYGRDIHFEKNLPDGRKIITHVFWVEPHHGGPSGHGGH